MLRTSHEGQREVCAEPAFALQLPLMEKLEVWSHLTPYHRIQQFEVMTLKCQSYEKINISPKPLLDSSSITSFLPCGGSQHRVSQPVKGIRPHPLCMFHMSTIKLRDEPRTKTAKCKTKPLGLATVDKMYSCLYIEGTPKQTTFIYF